MDTNNNETGVNGKIKFPIAVVFFLIYAFGVGLLQIVRFANLNLPAMCLFIPAIVFAIALFMKKRNYLLLIPVGIMIIFNFISLIQFITSKCQYHKIFFSVGSLCCLCLSSLTLFAIAFIFIMPQGKNHIKLAKKFWFVPGALSLLALPATVFWILLLSLPLSLAYLFTAHWLAFPYETQKFNEEGVVSGEFYCDMTKHVLLLLFTFGIYQYIWIYRTTKFCNHAPKSEQYNPTNKLLLCIFVPFYSIYWFSKQGQRLDAVAKEHGDREEMATLYLILGIFISFVAVILMQDRINKIERNAFISNNAKAKDENTSLQRMKEFKEMLDTGIITQEEFEIKKKQILDL